MCVVCRQPVSLHWVSTHHGRLQDLLPGTKSTSVTQVENTLRSQQFNDFNLQWKGVSFNGAVYKPSN